MWFSNELSKLSNEHSKSTYIQEDWNGKPRNKMNVLKIFSMD